MRKSLELSDPKSCLNKAESDEPLFVLRAKDPMAPQTVRRWVALSLEVHEVEKRLSALALADEMEEWYKTHVASGLLK